mmetsp:Transcript_111165/g.344831  ORF Transcript_111165/g.344831 Transcript_111165/m.344831 type:complete len:256 (+) Transcript_111165:801-1568(+)
MTRVTPFSPTTSRTLPLTVSILLRQRKLPTVWSVSERSWLSAANWGIRARGMFSKRRRLWRSLSSATCSALAASGSSSSVHFMRWTFSCQSACEISMICRRDAASGFGSKRTSSTPRAVMASHRRITASLTSSLSRTPGGRSNVMRMKACSQTKNCGTIRWALLCSSTVSNVQAKSTTFFSAISCATASPSKTPACSDGASTPAGGSPLLQGRRTTTRHSLPTACTAAAAKLSVSKTSCIVSMIGEDLSPKAESM